MNDNCIVAQSGGPTVAINASLAGVIDGVRKNGSFTRVFGAIHGIKGVLENNLMDLSLMALSFNSFRRRPTIAISLASTNRIFSFFCLLKTIIDVGIEVV